MGGKNKKNSYFFPITMLGHMPLEVGRLPGYRTVLDTGRGGSVYRAPPTLQQSFADGTKVFLTWWTPGTVPDNRIYYPRLRSIVRLRIWVRRSRTADNRALVRYYTPSLLGKRQYTNTLARVMKAQGY